MALAQLVNHLRHRDYLQRYLHVSSPEVYGTCVGSVSPRRRPLNPSTPYAASKAAADLLLGDVSPAVRIPVVDRAGDQRLRRAAAAVQDHPANRDLRAAWADRSRCTAVVRP